MPAWNRAARSPSLSARTKITFSASASPISAAPGGRFRFSRGGTTLASGWTLSLPSLRRGRHDAAADQAKLRRRRPPILGGLVDDAEQRARPHQRLTKTLLVALERIEAAAQQERKLILQHPAGRPHFASIAHPLAQDARLVMGTAIAMLGRV